MLEMEEKQAKELRQMVLDAMDVAIENRDAVGSASEIVNNVAKEGNEEAGKQAVNATENARFSLQVLDDGTEYVQLDGNLFSDGKGGELSAKEAYRNLTDKYYVIEDGAFL